LKKQHAACAGLLLLGLATAGTAAAQAVYAGPGLADPVLPPYEIMSIVRSTGLAPLSRPMRRGPYYVLVAVDRVGRQMRVVVDAQLGDIVNLRPALAAGSYGPEVTGPGAMPGVAVPPNAGVAAAYGGHPGADNTLAPVPPRSIPNLPPRSAAPAAPAAPPPAAALPPTRMAVAEPALPPPPPLPRPRPKLALNEASEAISAPTPAARAETVGPPAGKPAAPAAAMPSTVPPAAPSGIDDASKIE
jgi:hypothetical protein